MNTRFHPLASVASIAFALSAALAGPAWSTTLDPAQQAV